MLVRNTEVLMIDFWAYLHVLFLGLLGVWFFLRYVRDKLKLKRLNTNTSRLMLAAISHGYEVDQDIIQHNVREVKLVKKLEIHEWRKFIATCAKNLPDFQFEMSSEGDTYVYDMTDIHTCLVTLRISYGNAIWAVNSPFFFDRPWELARSEIINQQIIDNRETLILKIGEVDPLERLNNYIKSYDQRLWHPFEDWHDQYSSEYQRYKDLHQILAPDDGPNDDYPESTAHIKKIS
jgi:hypothetical protein